MWDPRAVRGWPYLVKLQNSLEIEGHELTSGVSHEGEKTINREHEIFCVCVCMCVFFVNRHGFLLCWIYVLWMYHLYIWSLCRCMLGCVMFFSFFLGCKQFREMSIAFMFGCCAEVGKWKFILMLIWFFMSTSSPLIFISNQGIICFYLSNICGLYQRRRKSQLLPPVK